MIRFKPWEEEPEDLELRWLGGFHNDPDMGWQVRVIKRLADLHDVVTERLELARTYPTNLALVDTRDSANFCPRQPFLGPGLGELRLEVA